MLLQKGFRQFRPIVYCVSTTYQSVKIASKTFVCEFKKLVHSMKIDAIRPGKQAKNKFLANSTTLKNSFTNNCTCLTHT